MVYILLGEGFEAIEAVVPADLLRRAGVEVAFVGLAERHVTGGHGITLLADLTLNEVDREGMEMLVLPGGLRGVESIQMDLFAMALIQTARDKGCFLAALCAAPTILADLGITDRRKAVCYPGMEEQMGSAIVQKGQRVVTDGHLITGEAAGSAFDFGLRLVEALRGPKAAEEVRHAVHYHG